MQWWYDIDEDTGSPIDIKVPIGKSEYYGSKIDEFSNKIFKKEVEQENLLSLISEIQKEEMSDVDKLILIDFFISLISLPSQNAQ